MLVVLCGPPASGKTTLTLGLRERLEARGHEFDVLHSDDFRRRTYERMEERVRETSLERNRGREDPISERGVHVTFAEIEPPRADLALDTDELSVEATLDRLEAAVVDWLGDGAAAAID